MAKSQIQQAIDKVDEEIATLQMKRALLVELQRSAPTRKPKATTDAK